MSEKILIIGGGFAGLRLARKLNQHPNKLITLIDRVNHHMFQPLFYQVASGRIEPSNISFPFRKIFQKSKNIQFRMANIVKIVPEENKVVSRNAEFHYDKLIIATGCKTNFYGNDELEEQAYGMKNTQEAISIRNQVLTTFERLIIERQNPREGDWNLVIVGGGPTGVELAGAFAEMKRYVLPRDYPKMNFESLNIILINATDHVLASMSEESQKRSELYLEQLGVTLLNNARVDAYDGKTIHLSSGHSLSCNNVIWAAGVTGNIIDGIASEHISKNRYIVDEYNRVKGYQNIFAIGDIAYMETPEYPHGHPQLASVAIDQGQHLGGNLLRDKTSGWLPFKYKDKGSMATIGKHRAVVDLPKLKFQGRFAWYFWMFLHLMLILSVRNKIAIFYNWAWSYFNKDSSLRLIIVPYKKNKTEQ
ncbi:FAD-dependent oxidoreductase [Elizabethkingia argentiflava]|uniref:NADH:ubiquinone reductase (non-electrogenic) n=1 Tax=Elizabethkingia argenteiflava TaxID=2681556 RepID=A0A845PUE0_9FLAO|nr:NAD(P)/FAD-dependent oxidoreductase [Elizabethkingia argenteiflava]NAW50516.1 FAD-dependent oxidoreductase [Elizabethkingia argenteiflava]